MIKNLPEQIGCTREVSCFYDTECLLFKYHTLSQFFMYAAYFSQCKLYFTHIF